MIRNQELGGRGLESELKKKSLSFQKLDFVKFLKKIFAKSAMWNPEKSQISLDSCLRRNDEVFFSISHTLYRSGFTILELLVVLAIIATASIFAMPAFQDWNAKRGLTQASDKIFSQLNEAKNQSYALSSSTRILTTRNGDDYSFTIYKLPIATNSCDPNLAWVQIKTENFTINKNFQVTGSGIGNVCFYRDGSSSGGNFNITQKDGGTNFGSSTISVILATSFIDVVEN